MNPLSILDAIDIFNKLCLAGSNAQSIVSMITGNSGSQALVQAIRQLDSDVVNGFKNVVDAIDMQTLSQNWEPYQESMKQMYLISSQNSLDLNTVAADSSQPSGYSIQRTGEKIDFAAWAPDVLTKMASFFQDQNWEGSGQSYYSFPGMFLSLSSDPSGSVLGLWDEICEQAQNRDQVLFKDFYGKSKFYTTGKLMAEFYMLISLAYYIHEATLKLFKTIDSSGAGIYTSIRPTVLSKFGSAQPNSQGSTLWQPFIDKLDSLSHISTAIENDLDKNKGDASYSCGKYIGPKTAIGPWDCNSDSFYVYRFYTEAVEADANSYITSLQFLCNKLSINDDPPTPTSTGGMIGVVMKITTYNPDTKETSSKGSLPTNTASTSVDVYNPRHQSNEIAYLNQGCFTPPTQSSNNHIPVIVGVQFASNGGNRAIIQVKWGVLDVNSKQVTIPDTSYHSPCSGTAYVQTYINMWTNPAGEFSKVDSNYVSTNNPITNVSFSVGSSLNNSLVVQTAPAFYKADCMQPAKLPPIMTS